MNYQVFLCLVISLAVNLLPCAACYAVPRSMSIGRRHLKLHWNLDRRRRTTPLRLNVLAPSSALSSLWLGLICCELHILHCAQRAQHL